MSDIAIAVIGGLFGVAGALVPIWVTRKRHPTRNVTNTSSIVDATATAVRLLREEVNAYRDETVALRAELAEEERRTDELSDELRQVTTSLAEYRRGVRVLITQLQRLGVTPDWQPGDEF